MTGKATTRAPLHERREERLRALIRGRDHMEGCPGEDGESRLEAHDSVQPPDPQQGRLQPRNMVVVRCLDCAGQRVHEDTTVHALVEVPIL